MRGILLADGQEIQFCRFLLTSLQNPFGLLLGWWCFAVDSLMNTMRLSRSSGSRMVISGLWYQGQISVVRRPTPDQANLSFAMLLSCLVEGPLQTPRKYAFDVTSVGKGSSPRTGNSVKVEIKFHLECKLHFPSAQLMLRQMHLTKVFESIETKY